MEDRNPIKVVCASVVETRLYGQEHEARKGTKHFRANAKVFVIDAYWGDCSTVTVIGHHRASGRYVKLDTPVKHLEDFRMEVVYSPKVLELIKEYYHSGKNLEEYAEELLRVLPQWKTL